MTDLANIRSGLRNAPLLICDIDEVVLEFLTPFMKFLAENDMELQPNSFALKGNIFDHKNGLYVNNQDVKRLTNAFFEVQDQWQTLTKHARQALANISADIDIIFLTAMPELYRDTRANLLKKLQMDYPLIASEEHKGVIVKRIHKGRKLPLFFIDDLNYNHKSVRKYNKRAHHIAIMANPTYRAMAPPYDDYVKSCENWHEIETYIRSQL